MGLTDDRIDGDGRLAGRTITDDQFALTAADRDHRVDRHDAGLHRLSHRPPPDDARRQLLDGIRHLAGHRTVAVERLAQRVDDPSEQTLADRHLQQLSGGAHLAALAEARVVAQHDRADFGFVEVQREPGDSAPEVEHLVEHRVGEAFDLGHAVADLANHADALSRGGRLRPGELGGELLQQVSHLVYVS